jgi:UDP-N-acetylglucosamine--dolichyl-phosphate N-acetylglucosaminephosphotransferase
MGSPLAEALSFIASFAVAVAMTFVVVPWLIPKLKARGVVGKDVNKPGQPEIAEMGGIAVVIGFFAGVGVGLAIDGATNEDLLNVSLSAALGAAFVGLIDDLFEIRQSQKAFFPFLLALPLGVTLNPVIYIPFIGEVDFSVWMIVIAPFAITCAANAANMLEGFNGLGTGLGIVMSCTLVSLALVHDRLDGLYLLVPLLGALVAFLWFNKYPSKIFPGDTLTLFSGATIAAAGMLSQLYIQTFFIFIPMMVEFFLKSRSNFQAENYSSNASNRHLEYHGKIESLTHIIMKHARVTERGLVFFIWGTEIMVCAIVIAFDLWVR